MPKIVKQFTKIILPFQFNKHKVFPEQVFFKNKKGEAVCAFERFSQHSDSLREGLSLLLDQNGGTSKIADCYKLNVNCRKEFSLPPRKKEYLDFISRQVESASKKVAIDELKLYFFESQVGFVEIEFEYESDSLNDYMDLNYFICEAKSDRNRFVYHEKVWDPESNTSTVHDHEFTLMNLLEKIFAKICEDENGITFLYKKTKPILYSYVLLDEKPEQINELIQHLNKNYKESYQFDDSCTKIKTLHSFENSYWTSSLNGATNLSFLCGNSFTDEFFENNFYSKVKDTYFFLFLNVLHQRYSIMRIMGEMGHLDRLSNDYIVMEEQLRLARRLEAEAINIKFRAFFKCPSGIDHINSYYDLLCDAFQVGAFYDNFSNDIKNLQNICQKYVDRIKQRDERFKQRKAAQIEIFVAIFGVVVAEVTLFNNSWSLIEKVMGHTVSFLSAPIFIMFAALLSPLFTVVMDVKKQILEIKRLTRLIEAEQDDNLVEDDNERIEKIKLLEKQRFVKRKKRNKKSI